jgi:hypothetical protein
MLTSSGLNRRVKAGDVEAAQLGGGIVEWGGGVLRCSCNQGHEWCSTRGLGQSSLTWRWSSGGCGVAWCQRSRVGKACSNGGLVLSSNRTGRAPIYRGFWSSHCQGGLRAIPNQTRLKLVKIGDNIAKGGKSSMTNLDFVTYSALGSPSLNGTGGPTCL